MFPYVDWLNISVIKLPLLEGLTFSMNNFNIGNRFNINAQFYNIILMESFQVRAFFRIMIIRKLFVFDVFFQVKFPSLYSSCIDQLRPDANEI